ncbi:MAG: efflux RND transporter permease subunit [Planctomycetota bacterium]|jgi:multidrug efflux pump subunit AcrB
MLVSISGDVSPVQLKVIADDLKDVLDAVSGVLKVEVLGALEPEIRLEFDPDRLALYNLMIPEILALIPSENVNISAGGLETEGTSFNVRIPAEFGTSEEVDHLLLTTRDGKPIYLSDVAAVQATFKDRTSFSRLNAIPNITLSIQKRIGANVVDISDYIKAIINEAQKQVPASVRFDITFDMAKYIRNMVADLENNIMSALILVTSVLILYMGWRTSMIVAMIIPLSMLVTFFLIQMLGFTLNMVVLFSLVLVLGMLVDNAIVIVENIYRHIQLGYGRMEAAILGAREVAWPVATSTLTTVGAFLPMMFWPGIMGDFMKYLPITLSLGLLSSLFVALVFSPVICSKWAGGTHQKRKTDHWFIRGYRRIQRAGLDNPGLTLFLAICLLYALMVLYGKIGKGTEFFPQGDPERAIIDVRTPQGTNIHETNRISHLIEERVEPYMLYIKHMVTNVGSSGGGMDIMASAGGPHLASITLVFYDYADRERPSTEIIAGIRQAIADIPDAEIKVEREKEGPPTGAPITVRVSGKDFKALELLSDQAHRIIADVSNVVNLRSDLEATRPELAFTVNRRVAALLGVNTATVGNFLKMAVFGTKVGTYRQYNDEYDITVRLPLARRINIDDLYRLQIPNASGNAVPISSLGHFDYRGGFGVINRVNQKRVVTLTADAEGRLSSEVLRDVQEQLKKKLEIPLGYEIKYAGEKETEDESRAFLGKAFAIALLLVTLVLVIQFNSIMIPMIIMTTVVLSLIGALTGLLICDMPFGIIMTGIGVISLAGVVVNNAIVLLAYTRQLQQRGMDLVSAAAEAGLTRLRPVLLTAATTIIGLIPMAIGVSYDFHTFTWATKSESSQWWSNMAVVVIFGLAFATILTLVVVPSLYVMLNHLWHKLGLREVGEKDPVREPELESA